ncbi:unnamed protein product [Miscanthus lutarioriparius]|uniref:Protein FAR1-RELATED SEQUENCE n=1 Tax=Miscanthus lutarioriparius TaxID=422564 RepID=A0A811RET2_9POAL|nr:unnamed protein product [Miscanthus lutarioriparius]
MVMAMEGERTEGDELIADYVDCLMPLDTNARPVHSDGLILGAAVGEGGTVGAGTGPDGTRDFPSAEDPNEPMLGMTFEFDEAAKAFYNEYARRLGFPFRVGRSRRSKGTEEVVVMKRFVCSKEGMYKKKQTSPDEATRKRERMSMREGCNAMMEVVREADHWVVSKLEKAHNHDLGTCSAKVGYLRAREHPTLRDELESCVLESETISTFETTWMSIIDRYDLRKNSWLQAIYNIRQKWVPLYLMDTFFVETSPTWKLETMNDFYKKYFNSKTTLEVFLNQFDLSLASRYEDEAKADMDACLNKATTKTASLIEKQAASTYTKAVFSKFQEEFTESLGFIIQKTADGCISKYSITKDEDPSDTFYVTYNASNKMANCSCKYFEFSEDNNNNTHDEDASQSTTSRYNALCADAIRCAEKGAGSEAVYKAAKDILQKAYEEIIAYERNPGRGSQRDAININEDVTIDDAMNDQSMPDSGRKESECPPPDFRRQGQFSLKMLDHFCDEPCMAEDTKGKSTSVVVPQLFLWFSYLMCNLLITCPQNVKFSTELHNKARRVVDRPPATKLATKLLSGLCESPPAARQSPRTASGTSGINSDMATMWCQNIATRKRLGFGEVDSRKASESQTFFPQTSTR